MKSAISYLLSGIGTIFCVPARDGLGIHHNEISRFLDTEYRHESADRRAYMAHQILSGRSARVDLESKS